MSVNITIRNVPEGVRDRIAAHASSQGRSMQEYLMAELEQLASKPTVEEWVRRVRERKQRFSREVTADEIVAAIRAGRR